MRTLLVFILIFTGVSPTLRAEATINSSVEQTKPTYTRDQQDALKHLNQVRAKLGLSFVKLNPYLTNAALSHAKYIDINNTKNNGLSAHQQTPGKKGFQVKPLRIE